MKIREYATLMAKWPLPGEGVNGSKQEELPANSEDVLRGVEHVREPDGKTLTIKLSTQLGAADYLRTLVVDEVVLGMTFVGLLESQTGKTIADIGELHVPL